MQTDTAKIENSLKELINYSFADESKSFEEFITERWEEEELPAFEFDTTEQQDSWIKWCEENNETGHIFYHILVLSSANEME